MGRIVSYKHGEKSIGRVDPRLWDIVQNAIAAIPYDAEIRSGAERGKGDLGNHSRGYAVDVTLIDPSTGKKLPDFQNAETFHIYEQYAQAARVYQQQKYQELNDTFRWGGYFSEKGSPFRGNAVDLMHLDITPGAKGAMALGSWDKGASKTLLKAYPGAVSNGGLGGPEGARRVAQYRQALGDSDIRTAMAPESIPTLPEGLRTSRMGFAEEGAPGDSPQGDLIDLLERRASVKVDPVEDGAAKGDLLDFLKVRAETVPAFDRMPKDFPDQFFQGAQNPRPERKEGRPFATPSPPPRSYPPALVAGLTPPTIGADPLADGSWVDLPMDEARALLEQSMDVRPRPERLAGRPFDPTITMEFERPGSQPAQQVASVPQGVAAPVPQQTIVATEPRPERLAGRPFMPGPTQPAPVPMPASGAAAARTAPAPDRAPVRTAMLPSGKPVEIGRSYQISGQTYIGGVDAAGRGTLNKADAGILKEAGSGTILGNLVDSEIGKAAASGLRQVRPAVSSALDTISSGASEVFSNVGDKLGEWFGGTKAETPATKTIRVRNPAYRSVIAPVPVEQTVMLDRFGIPTGEVGSRGGTAPVPQSRPNVPEFIEITVPAGSAPVPATMSAAARAGRSTSSAPRPASRSLRPVVAPRPATMSADLAARRDTAGSGIGGLVNVIGAILGTNARSPTRAPIPYQRGSGKSAQRAIYGSGGSSYGSSPGQMTAGLAPGDRVYNADTNSWGLKR